MRWIAWRNLVPAVSLAAIVGAALYSLMTPTENAALIPFEGSRAVIEGVVVRDRDVRDIAVRLTVRPEFVNGTPVSESKNILISANRFSSAEYGDRIRATGTLQAPEPFETDSGRTFNYPRYLFAHGISHAVPFAEVEVIRHEEGNKVVAFLLSIKHALTKGLSRALPEPSSALAEGLIVGEKQSLGDQLYQAFIASGVVHIIVLSGYNVALVINSVLFISLRVLPRLMGYATAAIFVVGFAVMTGGSETTIRATIMALLMMLARVFRRPAAALRGLLLAAATMAIINPFLVLYDLSFQLSVLATLGLILFSDALAARMLFVPKTLGLREIIATTLATQITVLPLLVLSVGAISLVFLPANALILPAVPLAMFLSFVAALVALLSPSLAVFAGFPAYIVLSGIIIVAEFFGTLPLALLPVPRLAVWPALALIALLYGFFLWRFVREGGAMRKNPPVLHAQAGQAGAFQPQRRSDF